MAFRMPPPTPASRSFVVELTLLTPRPEHLASSLGRIFDRLSSGNRSRQLLIAMPAIAEVAPDADRVQLRWVRIGAANRTEAENQVTSFLSALVAPYRLDIREILAHAFEE